MQAAVNPPYRAARVDDCGTRKLSPVLKFRRAPVLPEAGSFIFGASRAKCRIAKELQQVEIAQADRAVGALVGIADAEIRGVVFVAKSVRFLLRADRDEAHVDSGLYEVLAELAQLRERFRKERSTDVPQPHNEGR